MVNNVGFVISEEDLALGPGTRLSDFSGDRTGQDSPDFIQIPEEPFL